MESRVEVTLAHMERKTVVKIVPGNRMAQVVHAPNKYGEYWTTMTLSEPSEHVKSKMFEYIEQGYKIIDRLPQPRLSELLAESA